MEENTKMKEKLIKAKGANNFTEIDNLYIDTIKAKLELLQEKNDS